MRRVAVTGLGALTPIGNYVAETWENAKKGICGIDRITHYDPTGRKVTLAAEIKHFDAAAAVGKSDARKMDKFAIYAVTAAEEAFKDAGIDMNTEDSTRCGIIFSSGIGGIETIQNEVLKGNEKGYDRITPHFIPMIISNMAAGHIAIRLGFHGICTSVVTACAGGTNAVGDAFRQIRDGYQDVMVCGGSEAAITPLAMGGFTSMHALSTTDDKTRASIPFDKERNGFVMGEGAGALVLEEYEHAVRRGARMYCELCGYGVSCDANHVTAPLPDGRMAAACMEHALADAGMQPEDIDYINAHGTSTSLNDASETKAIRLAFKEHAGQLLVSSTKSMTGHLLGASGAVEAVLSVKMLQENVVLPTINYKVPDEACDLDIVPNVMRKVSLRAVMSNSLGFGGHNASIIMKKVQGV